MSASAPDNLDRLTELLADRATQRFDAAEQAELDGLLAAHPEVDAGALERVAAEIDLVLGDEGGALPDRLRRKIEAAAGPVRKAVAPTTGPMRLARAGWIAAAACLALVVWSWWPKTERSFTRGELIDAGAAVIPWSQNDRNVGGDVVWSPERQAGFLRFSGLAPNDPAVEQYQLWIFDAKRDDRYPVDGGVFDSTTAGEVIVPITQRIPVGEAVLFAVTLEQPGGVVVSDRTRLILVAKPG